jgi:hypothetical protein
MSDADSNLNVIISKRSESRQMRIQLTIYIIIELRTTYHRASDNISYLEIMTTIANAFGVQVYYIAALVY